MYQRLYFGPPIENNWNIIEILDESLKSTNLIAVRADCRDEKAFDCLQKLISQGKKIIGLSSYQEFPGKISNIHDGYIYKNQRFITKFLNYIVLWCHCFKNPNPYIPLQIPKILYSETDQYRHVLHLNSLAHSVPKKYDFFVSMPEGEWNNYIRGFKICQKWVNYMAENMNLKILVCGTNRRKDFSPKIEVIDFQIWSNFINYMNQCKFLFCTSIYDASPRIIVEALSLDIPVLLNKNILGGWKYITETTGMFFDPKDCIEKTITEFINKKGYQPLLYTKTNLNVDKNSELLAKEINSKLNLYN
jgi:glycosyltransferase involved in cell wall biosynthesis